MMLAFDVEGVSVINFNVSISAGSGSVIGH